MAIKTGKEKIPYFKTFYSKCNFTNCSFRFFSFLWRFFSRH